MLKDITLGQYFPGDTVVHRLDPRTKLILVIVFIVALFQANSWPGYGLVTLAALGSMALAKIKPGTILMLHGYDEANVNNLIPRSHLDPYSGYPGFKGMRCNIRKVERK